VAAAAATAAAASAAGEATGRSGGATRAGCGKDGKLDRGFLAGTLGAGDLLLLVNHNLLKVLLAVFADIFVDGHLVLARSCRINYSNLQGKSAVRPAT
jgi:hypothetical protein